MKVSFISLGCAKNLVNTEQMMALCREAGIATAVESNLLAEWKCVERLLPLVDEWMCDFKIFDGALHREMTGVGNERIRESLGRLVGYFF